MAHSPEYGAPIMLSVAKYLPIPDAVDPPPLEAGTGSSPPEREAGKVTERCEL